MNHAQSTSRLATGRENPKVLPAAELLAAGFTDIVYTLALIRGLKVNWLDFQLALWQAMARKIHHAARWNRIAFHELPATVMKNGGSRESRLPAVFADPGPGNPVF